MLNRLLLKAQCFLWSFRRADFYRDLADALSRRVGIRDQLDRGASNALMLKDTIALQVTRAMQDRLAEGHGGKLADLMRGIAPSSDQLLLQAVDDAGANQVEALQMCADAVEFQLRSLKKVAAAMFVPVVSIPIVAALSVITSQIVVSIAADSPPAVWEGFNGFVRWLAESINDYAVAIGLATVAGIALLVNRLPRWIGQMRLKFDQLPVFGLYRDYNAAVVLSALAMLIRSGKTMREALEALRGRSTPWLRWQLTRIVSSIEDNPNDYLTAFSRGLLPPSVRARLASLLDSGQFAEAMVALGTKEVDKLEARVERSAATASWTFTGVFVSIAVVLSVGSMTISTALSREADPAKMMQRASERR